MTKRTSGKPRRTSRRPGPRLVRNTQLPRHSHHGGDCRAGCPAYDLMQFRVRGLPRRPGAGWTAGDYFPNTEYVVTWARTPREALLAAFEEAGLEPRHDVSFQSHGFNRSTQVAKDVYDVDGSTVAVEYAGGTLGDHPRKNMAKRTSRPRKNAVGRPKFSEGSRVAGAYTDEAAGLYKGGQGTVSLVLRPAGHHHKFLVEWDRGAHGYYVGGALVRAQRTRRNPGMDAAQFCDAVKSMADLNGKTLWCKHESRLAGERHDTVYINFFNLTPERVKEKRGGGAEAENSRMMLSVEGFARNLGESPPTGKVKVKTSITTFSGPLRGKSGPPEAIAKYVAAYLTTIAAMPSNLTHANPRRASRNARKQKKTWTPSTYTWTGESGAKYRWAGSTSALLGHAVTPLRKGGDVILLAYPTGDHVRVYAKGGASTVSVTALVGTVPLSSANPRRRTSRKRTSRKRR